MESPVTLTVVGGADGGKDLQRGEGRELKQEAFNNLEYRTPITRGPPFMISMG